MFRTEYSNDPAVGRGQRHVNNAAILSSSRISRVVATCTVGDRTRRNSQARFVWGDVRRCHDLDSRTASLAPYAASVLGVLACVGRPSSEAARYAYTPKLRTLALIVIELESERGRNMRE